MLAAKDKMPDYARLPTFHKSRIRLVIETPRGSAAKCSYKPQSRLFQYSRPLPAGITYPYDWGFLPSTLGEDGDALDGMAVHQASTPPGAVIECRVLGALSVEQVEGGEKYRNDRYLLCPVKQDAEDQEELADGIPDDLKKEIEQFFRASILNTEKKLIFRGWKNARQARQAPNLPARPGNGLPNRRTSRHGRVRRANSCCVRRRPRS